MRRRKPQLFDSAATQAAGFQDPRSYIRRSKDSGALLVYRFGLDMAELRKMAFERSRGYCEMPINGLLGHRCQRNVSWETGELHHSPALSSGGDDSLESVKFICKQCHVNSHNRVTKWKKH